MNPKVLVVYASRYGQTRKISEYLKECLQRKNIQVEIRSIAEALPDDLSEFQGLILGSPIYVGKSDRKLTRWAARHRGQITERPVKALFLVDLNAADSRAQAVKAEQQLMEKFRMQIGITPDLTAHLIGALKYRSYPLWTRWILKQISKGAGGPTDTSRDHELTRWSDVDRFADQVANRLSGLASTIDKTSRDSFAKSI